MGEDSITRRRWEIYNAKGSIYQDGNLRHIRTQRTVVWSVAINGLSVLSLTTQLETASDLKVTPSSGMRQAIRSTHSAPCGKYSLQSSEECSSLTSQVLMFKLGKLCVAEGKVVF